MSISNSVGGCYPCAEGEERILSAKSLTNKAKRKLRTWQHFLHSGSDHF